MERELFDLTATKFIELIGTNESGADDQKVILFCQRHGLIPLMKKCLICKSYMVIKYGRGASKRQVTWRCSTRCCRFESSVKENTIFSRSRISIRTALSIMYMWVMKRCYEEMLRESGVTPRTLSSWLEKCRGVCEEKMRGVGIGGHGHTVEIDESLIARRKYNRGHRVSEQWVIGG